MLALVYLRTASSVGEEWKQSSGFYTPTNRKLRESVSPTHLGIEMRVWLKECKHICLSEADY